MSTKNLNRHPWDKWFRKNKFKLKKGVHFTCMPHSMSVQVRNAAHLRGIKVRVLFDDAETLVVHVVRRSKRN